MLTNFTWSENNMTRKFSGNFHTLTDFAKVEKKNKKPKIKSITDQLGIMVEDL